MIGKIHITVTPAADFDPTLELKSRSAQHFICGGSGKLTNEAKAELADFERWMLLSRPRPHFQTWRKSRTETPND